MGDFDKSPSHEEEHAGQRGQGDHVSEFGERREDQSADPGHQQDQLRAAAGQPGHRRSSGAGVDRERADQSARDVRQANAHEVATDVVGDRQIIGGRATGRGTLTQDYDDQGEGRRADDAPLGTTQPVKTPGRKPGVHGAELLHAVTREGADGREYCRGQYRGQRPWQLGVDLLAHRHDDERAHRNDDRPRAHVTELVADPLEARDEGLTARGDAEDAGQLVGDDDDADPGHEAGDDRQRQEVGEPAELEQSDAHHDDSRHDGCRGDQFHVLGRRRRRETKECHGEEWRDRRVGADRDNRIRADHEEDQRSGDESDHRGEGRHTGQL